MAGSDDKADKGFALGASANDFEIVLYHGVVSVAGKVHPLTFNCRQNPVFFGKSPFRLKGIFLFEIFHVKQIKTVVAYINHTSLFPSLRNFFIDGIFVSFT